MRVEGIALVLLLTGCQFGPPLTWSAGPTDQLFAVMPLWAQYQACREAKDLTTARESSDRLSAGIVRGVEPPAWMKQFGTYVASQPVRVTVDPNALSADCELRVARLAWDSNLVNEAEVRYRRIVLQYADPEYAYYTDQARLALTDLQQSGARVLARSESFRP